MKNERVVVTGGAGFVGSNIVRHLLERGAFVVVLDDFSTGVLANLPQSHDRLEVVRGSVADSALLGEVVKGAELVIHAAARNIIASTRNPRDDYETNIGGTLNVLLAVQGTTVKRVVYCSSASVYGNPRYLPINEDDGIDTLTPYAVSKLAGRITAARFTRARASPRRWSVIPTCTVRRRGPTIHIAASSRSSLTGPARANRCGFMATAIRRAISLTLTTQ